MTTSDVLYCWGEGFSGQQGTGSFSDRNTPGLVGGALAVQAVSAGGSQTCAYTTSSGSPYCWGNNERGQLGNGTRTIRVTPATVITGPASAPPILTAGYTEADWLRSEGRVGAAAEHRTGAPVKEVERPGRW
ncbi:MAG: hypothetical protein HY560_11600 [Gemmatimonadetes bacterium]|nr:hypothetical protein [Gemmatimonadota bacterium]